MFLATNFDKVQKLSIGECTCVSSAGSMKLSVSLKVRSVVLIHADMTEVLMCLRKYSDRQTAFRYLLIV